MDRKQSLKVELTRTDGQKLVIEAEGLSKKDFAELQSQMHEFMEGK